MHARAITSFLCGMLLAACGNGEESTRQAATGDHALPAPDAVSGSVTGMPNPGEATVVPADATAPPPADAVVVEVEDPMAPGDVNAMQPAADDPGPSPDEAVAALRDYFAAINARDFGRAHAAWLGHPQGPEQFAQAFADIAGLSIEIGPPGPVEGGSGAYTVELPVRLDVTRTDGRMERQSGTYNLQRSVDGRGDPPWKIARSSMGSR